MQTPDQVSAPGWIRSTGSSHVLPLELKHNVCTLDNHWPRPNTMRPVLSMSGTAIPRCTQGQENDMHRAYARRKATKNYKQLQCPSIGEQLSSMSIQLNFPQQ